MPQMSDVYAQPCRVCGGTGEVLTGWAPLVVDSGVVMGFGDPEVLACPACFAAIDAAGDDRSDRAKRLRVADRAREAWASRTFGPGHRVADSRMFRWLDLGQRRVFYGPDADRKAHADRIGAPF